MTKRNLVTGGNGFIGSAVVRELHRCGEFVRVFDDNSRGRTSRLADIEGDIHFLEGDIRDNHAVMDAASGVDCIYHLAFVNGTDNFYSYPNLVLDVGVRGMSNVLEAAKANNVKEFVLASSSEVYQTPEITPTPETIAFSIPDPMNSRYSYAAGKQISEIMTINFARDYFEKTIIFRPHNVYGPDMGFDHVIPEFIERLHRLTQDNDSYELDFPIQGSGDETRAFIFISDFIAALNLIRNNADEIGIYNIGTDHEVKIGEIAKLIGNFYQRDLKLFAGPLREGGTTRRCPDISKIVALGYQTNIPLDEGIKITCAWYDSFLASSCDRKSL